MDKHRFDILALCKYYFRLKMNLSNVSMIRLDLHKLFCGWEHYFGGCDWNTGESFSFSKHTIFRLNFFDKKLEIKMDRKIWSFLMILYKGGGFFKSPVNTMGEGGVEFLWILLLKEYRLLT